MAIIFVVVAATVNNLFFMNRFKTDVKREMVEQATLMTALAEETMNHVAELQGDEVFNNETMINEVREDIKAGRDYKKSRIFNTIPVVAGWTAAGNAAQNVEGMIFKVTSMDARNPEHDPARDPVEGKFRTDMLASLTKQVRAGGTNTMSAVNEATNQLHVMRAIRLQGQCLKCHGDPATSPSGDGKDLLGFRMEDWNTGDVHGAFEVVSSLDNMDKVIAGFSQTSALINGGVALLLVIGLILVITNLIIRPLLRLGQSANNLSQGQLNQELSGFHKDEIGSLAEAFRDMSSQLKTMITRISGSSKTMEEGSSTLLNISSNQATGSEELNAQTQTVASAAEEITTNVSNVAAAAEESSNTVQNIAAMTEEMSVTLRSIARHVQTTSKEMTRAVSSIEGVTAGSSAVAASVEEMSASISEVAYNTGNASQMANTANQKSEFAGAQLEQFDRVVRDVTKIVDTIKDIADQTNMLALNATIEAASAGDAGRGFAVVAAEVKALARQSSEAADRISNEINAMLQKKNSVVSSIEDVRKIIQDLAEINQQIASAMTEQNGAILDASRTVSSMSSESNTVSAISHSVLKEVEQIASAVNEASHTSDEIARNVEETSVAVREIAKMVEEASKGVGEVSRNVQGINIVSRENAKFAAQTKDNAVTLNQLAVELRGQVKKFNID